MLGNERSKLIELALKGANPRAQSVFRGLEVGGEALGYVRDRFI